MESVNQELIYRILADRNDSANYLVYADWLLERGEPRGSLIMVQHALRHEHEPTRQPFDRRVDPPSGKHSPPIDGKSHLIELERDLAKRHRDSWLGPLATRGGLARFRWRMGFVVDAYVTLSQALFEPARNLLLDFLERPVARLLQRLVVKIPTPGLERELLAGMTSIGPIPSVEALAFTGYDPHSPVRKPHCSVGLASLAATFPRLRSLRLDVGLPLQPGRAEFAELRAFDIFLQPFRQSDWEAIAAASWPKLATLVLHGDRSFDELDLLAKLLQGDRARRLKRLHLRSMVQGDAVVGLLTASTVLRRLEFLDLSFSYLTTKGFERILSAADHFRGLRQLALPLERLDATLLDRLRSSGIPVTGSFRFARTRRRTERPQKLAGR